MPALGSVRTRLILLLIAITGGAIGVVYLYVVPQLDSTLTSDRLDRLKEQTRREAGDLQRALRRNAGGPRLAQIVSRIAQRADARATVLGIAAGEGGAPEPDFVIEDSTSEASAAHGRYEVAAAALSESAPASGVETVGGTRTGQAAIVVEGPDGRPAWVLVLSSPLDEVGDTVSLIRRQIGVAGIIAILAAIAAAYLSSRGFASRLRGLEAASHRVAAGDFSHPVPIGPADELGAVATSFNEMRERLGRLDAARKEFIANASHELRTPIFSLAGFAELLDDEELTPETRAEFVAAIREQVDRMKKLAAELLDLSKLDSDAIELRTEPLDVRTVARQVAAEFAPVAQAHDSPLHVTGPDGADALADRDRVAQIVRILLDNALAHTPPGTRISMTSASEGDHVVLRVRDTGPGIAPDARPRVFDRFYSASARGSGLGLAIARELSELMDGSLTLESRAGRTEFTLSLPAAG